MLVVITDHTLQRITNFYTFRYPKRFNSCFNKLSFGTRLVWEKANGFSLMQLKSPQQNLLSRHP